jgi:uncharacterized protein (DUF983 family)
LADFSLLLSGGLFLAVPRCGQPFITKAFLQSRSPWATTCAHCGIRIGADGDSGLPA